ncbi:MAG TPA: SulP family inorganic anion transporter [Methanobacterium sp.]|nr:SulP family inorganic anion transporter [Methanobacterium sp.]
MNLSSLFPINKWARSYDKKWLRPDIIAGITVGAFTIPEAMAYVSLAGLPPEIGLYSAMVALLVYMIFGTSKQLSIGPTSTISILVGSTLGSLMIVNAGQYFMMASLVAVAVGILAIISWALRLGFIIKFISKTVLTGFLAGLALYIASGQLPTLLGISGGSGTFFDRIYYLIVHIGQTNLATLAIGIIGILFLIFATKKFPKLPNTLFLVLGSIVIVILFNLASFGVKIVGSIPQGLPALIIPNPNLIDVNILLTLAATVFLVSYVEGYIFASEYAAKNKYKVDKNKELLALGVSNVAVGLFQGLPIGGTLSRTAVADESGAKTQLAGGISGLVILLVLVLFTGIFYNLPQAILAAIVLYVIRHLVDIPHLRKIYNFNKIEFTIAIITMLTVLFIGALQGIVIGVILSVLSLLKNMYNPHIAILGRIPGTIQYLDIKRRPEAEILTHTLVVRIDGSHIFLNTESIKNTILDLVDTEYKDTKLFVLDFEATSFIDYSGIEMLEELVDELKQRGIKIKAANVFGPLRDSIRKTRLEKEIMESKFCLTIDQCIKRWESEKKS